MDLKETFLASLSDEQLGFFCAYEYHENLADMLQDEINVIQYQLFEKWKDDEKINASQNRVPSSSQPDFTDKMSQLFEMFAERIEAKIGQKIKSLEESYSQKLASIEIKIEQSGERIKKLEGSYSEKLASIEQQIMQVSTSQKTFIQKVNEMQSSISDVKQKFDKSEQHLIKAEESQQQQSDRLVETIQPVPLDGLILAQRLLIQLNKDEFILARLQ